MPEEKYALVKISPEGGLNDYIFIRNCNGDGLNLEQANLLHSFCLRTYSGTTDYDKRKFAEHFPHTFPPAPSKYTWVLEDIRPPRKGEWYLMPFQPPTQAPEDMASPFQIVRKLSNDASG